MRICSLLPGATEVVAGLGLTDELVAISHECDYPPEIRTKPVIIQSAVDPEESSSADIDQQVRAALNGAGPLYRINEILLRQINPTLIITQDLCGVCAVTPKELQRALSEIPGDPHILSLNASSLDDVFQDIEMIGTATGRRGEARRAGHDLARAGQPRRRRARCREGGRRRDPGVRGGQGARRRLDPSSAWNGWTRSLARDIGSRSWSALPAEWIS